MESDQPKAMESKTNGEHVAIEHLQPSNDTQNTNTSTQDTSTQDSSTQDTSTQDTSTQDTVPKVEDLHLHETLNILDTPDPWMQRKLEELAKSNQPQLE